MSMEGYSIGSVNIYPKEYVGGIWVEHIYSPSATLYIVPNSLNQWGYTLSISLNAIGNDKPQVNGSFLGIGYSATANEIWFNIYPGGDGNMYIKDGSYRWGLSSNSISETTWPLSKSSGKTIVSSLRPLIKDLTYAGLVDTAISEMNRVGSYKIPLSSMGNNPRFVSNIGAQRRRMLISYR